MTSLGLPSNVFAIWSSFWFHINLRIVLSLAVRNDVDILIGVHDFDGKRKRGRESEAQTFKMCHMQTPNTVNAHIICHKHELTIVRGMKIRKEDLKVE